MTPEQRLLLALTGIRERRRRDAGLIRALAGDSDPETLADLLDRHRVLALYAARLEEVAPGAAGPGFAERAAADRARNEIHGGVLEHALDLVVEVLAGAGVAALPIKGPGLARSAHGSLGLRRSSDLDVLVPVASLAAAADALVANGHRRLPDPLGPDGLPELHLVLVPTEPWRPKVELHWRVHWADRAHGATLLELSRGTAAERGAAELAILLLCYARDGFVGPRLAADLAGWWDASNAALPQRPLAAFTAAHPVLVPILATAAVVAERVCAVPADRLLDEHELRGARPRAARLADPVAAGDRQQLRAQQVAVDLLLLPPGGRRAFVRRQVADARRLPRPIDRLAHVPKVGARVSAALVRRGRPS